MNREGSTWARHLLAMCQQNARRMATDHRSVQERVAEALTSIFVDEGLIEAAPDYAIEPINRYTDYYLQLDQHELNFENIESVLSRSNNESARNIFEGLFALAEEVSNLHEVHP